MRRSTRTSGGLERTHSKLMVKVDDDRVVTHLSRITSIAYGKDDIGQYMRRKEQYHPVLRDVYDTWDNLDPELKNISVDLLPPLNSTEPRVLSAPHVVKSVTYSVYAHVIRGLCTKYSIFEKNVWHIMALLLCIGVTNCPLVYWYEVGALINAPTFLGGVHIGDYGKLDFGMALYEHLWNVKDDPKKKLFDYKVYPRHQPTHNQRMSRNQLRNSMIVLFRGIFSARKVRTNDMDLNALYYHHQLVAHFSQACTDRPINDWDSATGCGVYGAGGLLAQHYVAVAATIGLLPVQLLLVASISPTTKTWAWLKQQHGFTDENHLKETTKLINAISKCKGVSPFVAEEMVCKTKQMKDGTDGRFRDAIPPGCSIYFVMEKKISALNPDGTTDFPKKGEFPWTKLDGPIGEEPNLPHKYWGRAIGQHKMPPKKNKDKCGSVQLVNSFPLAPMPSGTVHEDRKALSNMKCLPVPHQETVVQTKLSGFTPKEILRESLMYVQKESGTQTRAQMLDNTVWKSITITETDEGSFVKEHDERKKKICSTEVDGPPKKRRKKLRGPAKRKSKELWDNIKKPCKIC